MHLVAQPQLTRTDLHEILRNPGKKRINRKIMSLRLISGYNLYIEK